MAVAEETRTSGSPEAIPEWMDFAHTGPGTLAGRFMRSFWQPVCRSEDLVAGRARPLRVMSEGFTLYRGESGAVHLLDFACAHRGTQLSIGWVEDDCIRCAYHGWVYDGTGQCVEQPAEEASFARRVAIRSYPVEEYLGLIFAYLGEGEPPALPRYPEFEREGVTEVECGVRNYNFFQTLENGGDHVHITFAHGRRNRAADGRFDLPVLTAAETAWGFQIHGVYDRKPEFTRHYGIPNIHQHSKWVRLPKDLRAELGIHTMDSIAWRAIPIDDESFTVFEVMHVAASGEAADRYREYREQAHALASTTPPTEELAKKVLAGELSFTDIEHMDDMRSAIMGNVGDYATQAGQGIIASRDRDRLGRSDAAIVLQRKIWARELRALADGEPRKEWDRTPPIAEAIRAADEAYGVDGG